MKINQIITRLLAIMLLFNFTKAKSQSTYLSKEQIKEDLVYLKDELIKKHPNLYIYSSPQEVEFFFEETIARLPDRVPYPGAYKLVSSVSGILKDGHSYIYPSAEHLDKFYNSALIFPLEVSLSEGNLLVIENFSEEQNIPIGSKLVAINDIPIGEIQETITQNISRDGDNLEYPKHLYYKFFPAYFSFFYGYQDSFKIKYESKDGQLHTRAIAGLSRDELRAKRNTLIPSGSLGNTGIYLKQFPENQLAVLTIKSFDKKILKVDYQQKFKKEIREAFKEIKDNKIQHLAIDLRNNQGGALRNGVFLLQNFADKPFKCVNAYHTVKIDKQTKKRKLKKLNSKWDDFFRPNKNRFRGKVYLFTNGGSFSCSAIVANTFKENKSGVILGQMTGGSAYINSGGPNEVISLPNSKVTFTIPKTQYALREDLSKIEKGVLPDIEIKENSLLNKAGNDLYMEKLKEIISKF